ncbi:protein-methionine-sulfoxide reductase heme-binding subunit MsrQ [Ideonella azotifigens]|uniref:Protein-methionine-sulfoxide reductase heme-binding subunit MsrQ n=1 Tax=Ideonella azotifigens TaxID=513160 RepID=A0ABN1KJB7_9BURK
MAATGVSTAARRAPPKGLVPRLNGWLLHPVVKPLLWLLLAMPAGLLLWGAIQNQLGPNPTEALIRGLGDWTLRLLCVTLAITPLRQWTGLNSIVRWRRNLGVATFLYGTLHWLSYAWFDQNLDLQALLHDVAKRPFILVGTAAWLAMLPLALTSFNAAIKRLGGKRWQALHKTMYAIALGGLLHFFWLRASKHNFAEVAVYATVIFFLLGWRVWRWLRSRRPVMA